LKADTPAGEDIRKKAFAILRRELSRGEFVRFLQSLYSGKGDYTADQQAIIGDLSIEEIITSIEAHRK
jgi:hypothetical protein